MKEKMIRTDYGALYFRVSDTWDANRKTIFFFHGLTADHRMFDAQVRYFQDEYNVIAWDAPMHGKSKTFSGFNMDVGVKSIQAILQSLSVEKIIAVGQSYGGYFVQALIARSPQTLLLFIGIGTSPYGKVYYSKSDYFWLKRVGFIASCYPFALLKKTVAKRVAVTAEGYENMMDMLALYRKREYVGLIQAYYDAFMQDNRDLQIDCPVLILRGESDAVGKVTQYCEAWQRRSGYPLEIVARAGHNANVDNPDAVNSLIEGFIQTQYPLSQ